MGDGDTGRDLGLDLPALLQRLHAELGDARTLDPESRRLLDLVLDDARRLDATPSGLETLAVRFEAEHPSLAASIRQVADVLGKAGI